MTRQGRARRGALAGLGHYLCVETYAVMAVPLLLACGEELAKKTEVTGHDGDCGQCHVDEWHATSSPPHAQAQLEGDCAACHDQQRWAPAEGFVHLASFPLTLGHAGPQCGACHAEGFQLGGEPRACVDCHRARAEEVVDPIHSGLPPDCFACHRTDAFLPAHFVHAWPLEGKHALTSCRSCHAEPSYEQTSPACLGCHAADDARADANSADHAGFPDTCDSCHGFEFFRPP